MPIRFDLGSYNLKESTCINEKAKYLSKIYNKSRTIRSSHILLALFILFHTIILPAAASSLSLSSPKEIDVSGEDVYEMNFISSEDARSLSALMQVPEGFSYTGNAKIICDGTESSCEPYQSGPSLQWDVSSALKSCRQIVINECY